MKLPSLLNSKQLRGLGGARERAGWEFSMSVIWLRQFTGDHSLVYRRIVTLTAGRYLLYRTAKNFSELVIEVTAKGS